MAKDPTDTKPPEEAVVAEAPPPPKGIPRLYILLGLAALVLLQTILLALMLPSPQSVAKSVAAANVEIIDDPENRPTMPPVPKGKSEKPIKTKEKPLGRMETKEGVDKYRVQDVNRAEPNSMSGFSCTVFAVIKESDERAFTEAHDPKLQRIAHEIQTILRESTLDERLESSLSTIRSRIKRRVSENFDIPYILDVIINDPQTEKM